MGLMAEETNAPVEQTTLPVTDNSAIQNELEAELLTGQQLNLETARLAAMKGDLATVGDELLKQGK